MPPLHPADRNAAPDSRTGTADGAGHMAGATFTKPECPIALFIVLTLCSLAVVDFISLIETHPQQNSQLPSFPLSTITKPQIPALFNLEHSPLLSVHGVRQPPLTTALDAGADTTSLKPSVVSLYRPGKHSLSHLQAEVTPFPPPHLQHCLMFP